MSDEARLHLLARQRADDEVGQPRADLLTVGEVPYQLSTIVTLLVLAACWAATLGLVVLCCQGADVFCASDALRGGNPPGQEGARRSAAAAAAAGANLSAKWRKRAKSASTLRRGDGGATGTPLVPVGVGRAGDDTSGPSFASVRPGQTAPPVVTVQGSFVEDSPAV